MGGSKSPKLNSCAQEIWDWCIQWQLWVSAIHIVGRLNASVDSKSHKFQDKHEWMLNKEAFKVSLSLYPEFNIDLFATSLNNQLQLYCFWKPDPGCAFVDALTIDWCKFNFYAFPPFSLIPRCLQKIAEDQAKGILIILLWPTQAWFCYSYYAVTAAMPSTLDNETLKEPTATCQPTSTPIAQQATPNGLSGLRESFTQYNVSPDITKILMASWRVGTQKQYKTYFEKWLAFCHQRGITYMYSSPKINESLDLLMTLYNQGLSYSTINTAQSAISSIITVDSGKHFGSHPLVTQFFKGIYELRKPQPKYHCIWDVSKVLCYLRSLHPPEALSLKSLTLKLVMLLLLVTGERGQVINLLSLDGMTVNTTSCQLQLLDHTKTSKPGQKCKPLVINEYTPDPRLRPLSMLKEYIQKTKVLRNSEKQLFISFVQPHEAVSRDTISRWTKDILKLSGIDITTFTAHSTRAATTSKANAKDVPLDVIVSTFGWASEQTFSKFYNKPVAKENDMVDAVLSSVTKN